MKNTPNLVQRQTGVYQYPKLTLPPVTTISLNNPPAPSRPAPAPLIPANTVNQVRK